MSARKIAVILFNLGGPDELGNVRPFLQNLFSDKAIIDLPAWLRLPLAAMIARRRAPSAQQNYASMGGGSPLLPGTERQATALQSLLEAKHPGRFRTFIAMRYWHPFTAEAARAAAQWGADEAVLLPLYPQFSTTTTRSSFTEWRKHWHKPAKLICCYPERPEFAAAYARTITENWHQNGAPGNIRVLFSAHGLPERVVAKGDPYQSQVERSARAIGALLPAAWQKEICYQSKVGPLKWIGPSTESEIIRAGRDGKAVIVAPIAFVSEHIETLVELDIEYRHLAAEHGVPVYLRAPAIGVDEGFIGALSEMIIASLDNPASIAPGGPGSVCSSQWRQCPLAV